MSWLLVYTTGGTIDKGDVLVGRGTRNIRGCVIDRVIALVSLNDDKRVYRLAALGHENHWLQRSDFAPAILQ